MLAAVSLLPCGIARVVMLPGMSWGNMAWGFASGGGDVVLEGTKVVLVDPDFVSSEEIASFHSQDRIVMCYVSVGTVEGFRQDYKNNKQAWDALALGEMSDWGDEQWLDMRQKDGLVALMRPRFERAAKLGCDVVEGDNQDCFDNQDCWKSMGEGSGKMVIAAQITYLESLAQMAHDLGMGMVQKNAAGITADVAGFFDGVVTENCLHYKECGVFQQHYVNRAHFNVEYKRMRPRECSKASQAYPGMATKYCVGNKGRYLCRTTKKQQAWINC